MARFYADENFPFPVVVELRGKGHDVLSTAEAGLANQAYPDEAILATATSDQRTVLTTNRKDFIQLHKKNPNHAGIIVCTTDLDFSRQATRIHDAVADQEELAGKLIRINRPQKQ